MAVSHETDKHPNGDFVRISLGRRNTDDEK